MAFKDSNGKITIDEGAAQKDITNIKAATEHLSAANRLLTQMINIASEFSGETGKAIVDALGELQKQVNQMMDYSFNTISAINSVVKKYEQIDRELKSLINNYAQNE